ncbi:hypothetical protein LTR56_007977 [Elasticomyces elasticus]|nr:hypothetical protein LTR56_007977 [Elasticomyces elasticus]KAK3649095.1 hypothetical protein LTR22_013065 [Elasticomyces elasticus]KAK4908470.1 hypothetical protein LTR49_022617 [Elasticomyces elasticus]KAK5748224.1 hypothetical protein LTS12_021748 [Elasticomyces elasticus]
MAEYETDRWRIIAGKVGNGFSAAACRDKAVDIDPPEVTETTTTPEATPRRDARAVASAALPSLRTTETKSKPVTEHGVIQLEKGCVTPEDTPLNEFFKFDLLAKPDK